MGEDRFGDLLGPYVLGELTPEEERELERHLEECSSCWDELRVVWGIHNTLREAAASEPPPELRARTLARAKGESSAPSRPRLTVWVPMAAALLVAAFLGFGLLTARHGPQRVLPNQQRSYSAPPVEVNGAVASDAVEPGRETRPFRIERFCFPPDAGEGILDQFLGQEGISQKSYARGVHRSRVAIVEFQEGPLVSPRYPADQGLIPHVLHLRVKRLLPAG